MTTERKPNRPRLSPTEKRRLARRVTPERKEKDDGPIGLPPISDSLRQQLLEFLNLDGDANTKWEAAQARGEPFYPPLVLASQMVQDELGALMASCEVQTIPIRDWVNSEFRTVGIEAINGASVGAALVIKAYHLMYGEDFIKGFGKLHPRDIMEALRAESRPPIDRFSLMNIATRTYHMPAHQYNLQFCLSELAMAAHVYQAVVDGGIAVFRMLDRHASTIIPSTPS